MLFFILLIFFYFLAVGEEDNFVFNVESSVFMLRAFFLQSSVFKMKGCNNVFLSNTFQNVEESGFWI